MPSWSKLFQQPRQQKKSILVVKLWSNVYKTNVTSLCIIITAVFVTEKNENPFLSISGMLNISKQPYITR